MKGIQNLYHAKKKRLSQAGFFASLVNFYIAIAFETLANYFTNIWMTASESFIIETTFCERDKNLFFNGVAFYFIWLLL